MARPRRPLGERQAILAIVGDAGSARARAQLAAKLVTTHIAEVEGKSPEDLAALLGRLSAKYAPNPLSDLAELALGDFRAERARLFQGRGCRQLSAVAWQDETREILKTMRPVLARRYARALCAKS